MSYTKNLMETYNKMKTNLFINFYVDKNPIRQRELEICVLSNVYNKSINTINILSSEKDNEALRSLIGKCQGQYSKKIIAIPFEDRPTYNDYFKLTEKFPDDINIVSNTDMIMDVDSLEMLKNWHFGNFCLALSRWDYITDDLRPEEALHFNRSDSQDTWIVKGSFPQIPGVNFGLGIAGCDNRIADLLSNFYQVVNPSYTIKTFHYHLSQVRNYLGVQGVPLTRVDPPYKLINPSSLEV